MAFSRLTSPHTTTGRVRSSSSSLLPITTYLVLACLFVCCCFTTSTEGFLPGIPDNYYTLGDAVKIKTRKLSSTHDLAFDFYSVPYCKPKEIKNSVENLGEYLMGDRIHNSVYSVEFMKDITCKRLSSIDCKESDGSSCVSTECPTKLTPDDIKNLKEKIDEDYLAQLVVDQLPFANLQGYTACGNPPPSVDDIKSQKKLTKYSRPDGFPVGCKEKISSTDGTDKYNYYLNNHLTFVLYYHTRKNGRKVIVGAEVYPTSVEHTADSCKDGKGLPSDNDIDRLVIDDKLSKVEYSYSVIWKESDIAWGSRFDAYINTEDNPDDYRIHWFSIINSLLIVFFLTGMVGMIMLRILRKDITLYNERDEEDPGDETGWKLVHGDVFRTPKNSTLLSLAAGAGIQVLGCLVVALFFSLIGFISPESRGSLPTAIMVLFAFMGITNGYVTLRLYKMFQGKSWKTVSLLAAFAFPAIPLSLFTFINFLVWASVHSTSALPFLSLLEIFGLWLAISVPLVVVGGFFGFRAKDIEVPVKTLQIPRQIPVQPVYMHPVIAVLMGGVLPFGSVFIQSYFILSSIWLHQYYYLFGFLFVVFLILIATSAEISVVFVYFQLCNEDYRWWWRSFLCSGSSALYLFIYSAFYYFTSLEIDTFMMALFYFGYSSILCYFFFVLTGAVGFFTSLWFVKTIYGSIKVD
ncbi:hypothetical protein C9374_008573 [Naegleria lovaniensis]|uniref:Transmembrane 9 superfamily member n=1 Tax=Naegleria lovaniensis TaxID=51637 RepID=A0AA88KH90_NAELO|nr:uncharacterized protein C9374_008573 [Naegleria lovaniensis]KAG2377951.1 hypothetical protein C9374_008573 [Naegleria lovaniensis]